MIRGKIGPLNVCANCVKDSWHAYSIPTNWGHASEKIYALRRHFRVKISAAILFTFSYYGLYIAHTFNLIHYQNKMKGAKSEPREG